MPSSARSSPASSAASWPRSTAPPRSSPACACSDARPMASLPSSTCARPAAGRSSWSASACATPASRFARSWASSRCRVRSHQNLLEQALVNLLVNARDALQQSMRPDKTIVLSTSRGDNGHVLITVSRQRTWRVRRDPRTHLRAVLHLQADRTGHRPRPVAVLRHRPRSWRHAVAAARRGGRRLPDRPARGDPRPRAPATPRGRCRTRRCR